jgi:hypothetical protein
MSDDKKNDPAPDPTEVSPGDLEPVAGGCFADPTIDPIDPGPYDPTGPLEPVGPIRIQPWIPRRDFPGGGPEWE